MNFFELWHQAYALGAQVVFWPSMMSTPDRDAISAARLFRYHIVANGWKTYGAPRPYYSPGTVLDTTGTQVADFRLIGKPTPALNTSISIGTMDLDATVTL